MRDKTPEKLTFVEWVGVFQGISITDNPILGFMQPTNKNQLGVYHDYESFDIFGEPSSFERLLFELAPTTLKNE